AADGSQPQDASDEPFLIANNGNQYFVSPSGDNRNSGKSANQPMKTLAALVDAYDLDPGDSVQVASGTYRDYRNLVLRQDDGGVLIYGLATGAVLNRGNQSAGSYVVEMAGADEVTLAYLELVGGNVGLYAGNYAGSDELQVSHVTFRDNNGYGLFAGIENIH